MDNSKFNYSLQYCNWHADTKQSYDTDLAYARKFFSDHNIYPKKKDSRICEIGCGMGRFLSMLKEEGYDNLTGVDIDKVLVKIARRDIENIHLADAIDFLSNTHDIFDVIYVFDVLEHIAKEKQLEFLRLIYSRLKDDGFVVFSIPNALAPSGMLYRYDDFTHTVSYCSNTISFLLSNAGFPYMNIRPQYKESEEVINMKKTWADIYRIEFGMKDVILTPNLVVVAFKIESMYNAYMYNAPVIENNYGNTPIQTPSTQKMGIAKVYSKIIQHLKHKIL